MTRLNLAIVQRPPVFLNLAASVDLAESLVADARQGGAQIVVFPETWLPGYPVWLDEAPGSALWGHRPAEAIYCLLFANCPTLDGPELARLSALAVEQAVDIVMGLQERRGASIYNSVVRFGADGERNVHRKIMPTHNERLIWAAADGSTLGAWSTPHGNMGALICWEHWMPFARAVRHQQAEAIHFALWPAVTDLHMLASRHYAFEGQCFVAAAGTVLTRQDVLDGFDSLRVREADARDLLVSIPVGRSLLKSGASAVIAPDAAVQAAASPGDASTLHAELDLSRLAEGRLYLDTAGHYARPDLFELLVETRPRAGIRHGD